MHKIRFQMSNSFLSCLRLRCLLRWLGLGLACCVGAAAQQTPPSVADQFRVRRHPTTIRGMAPAESPVNTTRLPWSTISSAVVFRAIVAGAASLRENELTRRAATRRNHMKSVGVIHQLTRYPVKSMQGEALPSAALTLQGFAEDRRYAFVQATSRSSFPWLTARELPELLYYRTSVEKADTAEVAVTVVTAHGEHWPIESDDLRKVLEARSGRSLFLLRDYRGSYDVAPVSLISWQT